MNLETLGAQVAADPNNAQARLEFGRALLAANRPDDALDHLRKALVLRRDYLEAYLALGETLLAEGEHIAAIATLEGGREIARKVGNHELAASFDSALDGLGPVKRRGGAPLDEHSFHELATKTIAEVAKRIQQLARNIQIQHSPSILVFDVAGRAKMGISEQRTPREIWCSCALGEFKFRYIPSSKLWRSADGDELYQLVNQFISKQFGESVAI